MYGMNALHGLQFEKNGILDNDIQPVRVERLTTIVDWNGPFAIEPNSLIGQLITDGALISHFDQARAKFAVNRDAAPNRQIYQLFDRGR